MSHSLATTLTIVILFFEALSSLEACTCMPIHPQTAYCRSDFVIKATVISDRQEKRMKGSEKLVQLGLPIPVFAHYDVKIKRVYKGLSKIANITGKVTVHTSLSGAQCGVTLTKGTKYLIMGTIIGGRLQINHCNYLKEFHQISMDIKHGLHGNYNCDCLVSACVDGYCDIEGGCPWNIDWAEPADECTEKHRYCKRVERIITNESKLRCEWSKESSEYNKCKKTRIIESLFP